MILTPRSGARAFARSTIVIDGIFGMKISPPFILSKFLRTKFTPCSSVIQNLVIFSCVIGSSFSPCAISFLKSGTTDPREPTTFPYLTTLNLVFLSPTMLFAATKSLSLASFVAPYKFTGLHALSVESAITLLTPHSKEASMTF